MIVRGATMSADVRHVARFAVPVGMVAGAGAVAAELLALKDVHLSTLRVRLVAAPESRVPQLMGV
jgi:hypothetical protein